MSEKTRTGRNNLLLIGALCVVPVFASYFMYYFAPPQKHTNYGDLIAAVPLTDAGLQLVDGRPFQLSELRGKWVLLTIDAGVCDDFCREKLFTLRQLRLTQGKDMERIERVWLISDMAAPPSSAVSNYPGTWLVRAAGSALLSQLPAGRAQADHLYLIDPLGNLMMRYPRDHDPARIIKDLARLLKTSRIG